MNEQMKFPNTFEEFVNDYSFRDSDEVYTNGCELIPVFRVMQGYEHFSKQIREDAIAEISREMRVLYGNEYEKQIRADAIEKCKQILLDAIARDGKTKCYEYMVAVNEMEQLKEQSDELGN